MLGDFGQKPTGNLASCTVGRFRDPLVPATQSYVENYVVATAVFISKGLALQSSSECAVVQSYATMFSISSRSLVEHSARLSLCLINHSL